MIYSCAVWGKKYCNLYIKYALPSHLAKNNADYLTKNDQYVIFTNESGKEFLNKSPQLRILAQYVTIKWKITKKKRLEWKDMTNFHKMVIDYSQKKDTGCVFLGPDFIISQGTIKRIKELVSGGKKLILAPGLRTDYEKFKKKIQRHIKRSQLSISNIKLANHIAQCMHRITKSQFLNSSRFTFWPSAIINSDTNSGNYCIQSLHIHPIYAKPENTRNQSQFDSIDGEFLESFINEKKNIYISQSSEDIILAEISESKKTLAEPNSRNLFKLTNFARFIVDFSNELHRYVFNKPYYLITKATGQLPKPIKFPRELYAFFLLKKKIVQSIVALRNYLNRRMSRIIEKGKKYIKISEKENKKFFSLKNLFYRIIYYNYQLLNKMFKKKIAYKYMCTANKTKSIGSDINYILRKERSFISGNLTYFCKNKKEITKSEKNFYSQKSKKPLVLCFGKKSLLEKKLFARLKKSQDIEKISLISCNFSNLITSSLLMTLLYKMFKNCLFEELVFAFKAKPGIYKAVKKNIMSFITANLVGIKIILK